MRSAIRVLRVVLVGLVCACGAAEASAPAAPPTIEAAQERVDEAVVALGWAVRDLWALGGRDVVVSVQLDSTQAPYYFRLPRPRVSP